MIRRLVLAVLLLAMSGLLVFGAVHRTGHVLASEEGGSGGVHLQQTESEGEGDGSGLGTGRGNGGGQGAHRGGAGQQGHEGESDEAAPGDASEGT